MNLHKSLPSLKYTAFFCICLLSHLNFHFYRAKCLCSAVFEGPGRDKRLGKHRAKYIKGRVTEIPGKCFHGKACMKRTGECKGVHKVFFDFCAKARQHKSERRQTFWLLSLKGSMFFSDPDI